MKKTRFPVALCLRRLLGVILLFAATKVAFAQSSQLVCKDLTIVSLGDNCSTSILPAMVLEGGPYDSIAIFYVELDKTPPFGNGPWVPALPTLSDLGKTYQVRVSDPTTGNKCWGNTTITTYLECSGLTTVALSGSGFEVLQLNELQTTYVDGCTPGNTFTPTAINEQGALSLNCANLGVSTISIKAVDAGGKIAYCNAALLVTDPEGACDTCLVCPPPAFVTFDEAVENLFPAIQSGNLSAFDAFGDVNYLSACTFDDSTYTVVYHPAATNESWFIRRWAGRNASDSIIGVCEQPIIFTFDRTVEINGHVFVDTLENCIQDALEFGLLGAQVIATRLPSGIQYSQIAGPDGAYHFDFHINGLDSMIIVELALPNGYITTCPNALLVPAVDTVQSFVIDFGVPVDSTICPNLEVSFETPLMRRCWENTYYIKYCNTGVLTAPDAYITLQLDPRMQATSSSIPWTDSTNNVLTIPLGDVPPLSCHNFTVKVHLDCDAPIGETVCSNITIYPNQLCGNQTWTGPVIETSATCDGDSVHLTISNTGLQDMTESLEFIVIEDIIMYRDSLFQLDAGASMTLAMAANGSTWRIEAEQAPGNPLADNPSASVEACGGLNNSGLINAFAQNDAAPYIDRNCIVILGSFDPNDKAAVPTGYSADHIIKENTDLEYKIRFQNTGNDTAFKVVIVDTLSQNLDFASIKAGASSHPHKLSVFQGGILHFIFDPIMLPDSNINEPASHGFVSFRISQKQDLPIGTVIQNTAHIYFDFNDAVVTNTVVHTIGAPFITVATQEPSLPGVVLEIQPNPFSDLSMVRVKGHTLRQGLMTLYDAQGKAVLAKPFEGSECALSGEGLAKGLYYLQVTDGGQAVSSAKVMVW